jgi:hypothetical protein
MRAIPCRRSGCPTLFTAKEAIPDPIAAVDRHWIKSRHSIAELTAFEAELARLARHLDAGPAPAACGEGCGCPDHPLPVAQPPTACTLPAGQVGARLADWRRLAAAATVSAPTPEGWRLRLPADGDLAGRVAALAVAEQCCCPFFGFRLEVSVDGLELHVSVPAEARPLAPHCSLRRRGDARTGDLMATKPRWPVAGYARRSLHPPTTLTGSRLL